MPNTNISERHHIHKHIINYALYIINIQQGHQYPHVILWIITLLAMEPKAIAFSFCLYSYASKKNFSVRKNYINIQLVLCKLLFNITLPSKVLCEKMLSLYKAQLQADFCSVPVSAENLHGLLHNPTIKHISDDRRKIQMKRNTNLYLHKIKL